jgi:hypothetical protein
MNVSKIRVRSLHINANGATGSVFLGGEGNVLDENNTPVAIVQWTGALRMPLTEKAITRMEREHRVVSLTGKNLEFAPIDGLYVGGNDMLVCEGGIELDMQAVTDKDTKQAITKKAFADREDRLPVFKASRNDLADNFERDNVVRPSGVFDNRAEGAPMLSLTEALNALGKPKATAPIEQESDEKSDD